jgi:C4-dicarboxylate transporter DctM subunit
MVPVIILGGIYGGIMTPTEAAGVAALYGFFVGLFVLKGFSWNNVIQVLVDSSVTAATVLFLVAMASVFGYVMAIEQIPDLIAEWMIDITSNKYLMLLIVNILLLIVGALMESASATLILAPILMPMMVKLGVDPVHFGVILVCNLAIGFITPPIGQSLFVAAAISDERTEHIAMAAIPLIAAMLLMILLVTYIPSISLFLPSFM